MIGIDGFKAVRRSQGKPKKENRGGRRFID